MADPLTSISTRVTPQSEPAAPGQVRNAAGGYVWRLDDMARLRRFLTMGTTGGTYHVSEKALTAETASVVLDLCRTRGSEVVATVVEISTAGRALRQDPALFTLAAVSALGDLDARRAANAALPAVARTGGTLKTAVQYRRQFGGWGRGWKRAVAAWFTEHPAEWLAYQAVKYRARVGYTDRDLLRLAHPGARTHTRTRSGKPKPRTAPAIADPALRAVIDWMAHRHLRPAADVDAPAPGVGLLAAFDALQAVTDPEQRERIIAEFPLPWEALPDSAKRETDTWEAMIVHDRLPPTALMRHLPVLTRHGLLDPHRYGRLVAQRLADPERLRRGRVHPMALLIALRTYANGVSARGDGMWEPQQGIIDALHDAFYASFPAVEPIGGRVLCAVDISGSMANSAAAGSPLTCREAATALALVLSATEPDCALVAFTAADPSVMTADGRFYAVEPRPGDPRFVSVRGGMLPAPALTPLPVSKRQRLDDALRAVSNLPLGATDCSLPIRDALTRGQAVDTFIVLTDGETWAGPVHAHQALAEYRRRTGINARMVTVAMTGTGTSIADPSDPGMLDVAGFDAAVPLLIAEFARGL